MRAVVIPAYNEAETIEWVVSESLGYGAQFVIVADDGSRDRTAEIAERAGAEVVPVPKDRRGLPDVYRTGVAAALKRGAEFIVEVDAGGSHDPRTLPLFWAALGIYGIAFGSRLCVGGRYDTALSRRLLTRFGTWMTNVRHRSAWTDATSGFTGYRREEAQKLLDHPLRSTGHFYQTEVRILARRFGLKACELPIRYRATGSSLRFGKVIEALVLCLRM